MEVKMAINSGYTRRSELRCTLEEADTYSSVILYDGEVIYIQQTDESYAIKIGDGVTPLRDLAYVVNYSNIRLTKEAAETARNLAEKAQEGAEAAKDQAEAAVEALDIGLSVVDGAINITYNKEN